MWIDKIFVSNDRIAPATALMKVMHADESDSVMLYHNQLSYRRKNHIFPIEYECLRGIHIWHAAKRDITDKNFKVRLSKAFLCGQW